MEGQRLLFIVVNEVYVCFYLTIHVRDVGVAHMVGCSGNVKDLGLVDKLAGGPRELIVIGQGLLYGQLAIGPVELNFSSLVCQIVVVLTIV